MIKTNESDSHGMLNLLNYLSWSLLLVLDGSFYVGQADQVLELHM